MRGRAFLFVSVLFVLAVLLAMTPVVFRPEPSKSAQGSAAHDKAGAGPQTSFADYPAPARNGQSPKVKLNFEEPRLRPFRQYRALLERAVRDGLPNFAGHYKLVDIPCGTGCHYWWLVDLLNGEIIHTPSEYPVRFDEAIMRSDSRLVLFKEPDFLTGRPCSFAYYEWQESERRFRVVKQGALAPPCQANPLRDAT